MNIGRVVNKLRLMHDWSTLELSRQSGVAQATLKKLETGHGTRIFVLEQIAKAFGVRLSFLIELAEDETDSHPDDGRAPSDDARAAITLAVKAMGLYKRSRRDSRDKARFQPLQFREEMES
jgi:transcriptional regulator with XRE-family HTH domain